MIPTPFSSFGNFKALNIFKYCKKHNFPAKHEFKNSKIKTNKYLNNDITKSITVKMKAFREKKKLFPFSVAVL